MTSSQYRLITVTLHEREAGTREQLQRDAPRTFLHLTLSRVGNVTRPLQERAETRGKYPSMDFTQYTREGLAQRKKDSDAALNVTKKRFYATFIKSWDSASYGVMTPARFWSRFTHLKQEEDFLELRKHYAWCEKKGVPFAPYVWNKYGLSTDSSHSR